MAKNILKYILFVILTSSIVLTSCSKEKSEIEEKKDTYLVSTEIKYAFPEALLESSIQFPNIEEVVKNGITTYKLTYNTKYEDQEIVASGTVTFPDTPGDYPLVLVERGTILNNESCPSEQKIPSYEALSGMGYIVFVPDLIGYGASNDILHPYFDYIYSATASIDMYRAVIEYIDKKENTSFNNKFFISGYSQGGYSAMATYKYIVDNDVDIDIKAIGTGAGGYNVMSIVDNVLKEDTYPSTILLAMPMVTYNELYTHKPISQIFNSPYDVMVQDVIDGNKEWSDISPLPTTIKDVFNPQLIDNLKAGNNIFLTQSIMDNSVHNWDPQKPLKLYHYPLDQIIPIETTYSTLEIMKNNGAKNVSFVEIPSYLVSDGGGAHSSAGFGSLFLAFTEFNNY